MSKNLIRVLAICCLLQAIWAQGTTSRLVGIVTDPSGAAMSNASVKLTNEGTGTTFATVTGTSGAYWSEALQPGQYDGERSRNRPGSVGSTRAW